MNEYETMPAFATNTRNMGEITGLTQLDYMAAQAMQGLLASVHRQGPREDGEGDRLASICYDYAEAMLREKQRRNPIENRNE